VTVVVVLVDVVVVELVDDVLVDDVVTMAVHRGSDRPDRHVSRAPAPPSIVR
jgi:hypothetical protein